MCDVNTDNEEFEEMPDKEQEALNKFFEDNKDNLIIVPSEHLKIKHPTDICLQDYLWDDWGLMNEYFKDKVGEEAYMCTVITGDNDTAWVVQGRRWVNRMGYFVSKKPFVIDDREDIRYW